MWKSVRTIILAAPLPAFPAWLAFQSTSEVLPVAVGGVSIPVTRILLTAIFFCPLFVGLFRVVRKLDEQAERVGAQAKIVDERVAILETEIAALRIKATRLDNLEKSIQEFQYRLITDGRIDIVTL